MPYYPISLHLEGRRCVVVGGSPAAEVKATGLMEAGARVTVIAPSVTGRLAALHREGGIARLCRDYRPGDLAGAFLVISAHDDSEVNARIWREATERNLLMNTVDGVRHSNFIAPSVVRRGDLTLAISTAGKAPALAVRLRERLERTFGPEYARFLALAGRVRASLSRRHPDFHIRRALWYRLVDSDVIELLRRNEDERARRRMTEILGVAPEDAPVEDAG